MTVNERVLAQLRHGPIKAADFDCQPAIDGGRRHTRLAARICDLKAQGHDIIKQMIPLGDAHVAEYTLVREAGQTGPSVGIAAGLADITDVAFGGPSTPYEYEDAA